ncbi:murein hydrolase activator EnvC family protein [Halomonas binhaiensis]|uniref:Peptidoglycan DD-metalloendopeptidase family protein n=1 Tax=Halomonas binhaiensis TaxID=2562282 RepID=A0A5C1NIU0_9GAMM|nr:peptidoglycan DD-metalloendopeptidase family protein [Halomonas binhaiensis]QEM83632.1 peptidoglycan DD-metalloendopeptidase family protein [Halomonas binhaiensis]
MALLLGLSLSLGTGSSIAVPSENDARARLDAIGEQIQGATRNLANTDAARDEASQDLRKVETELAETHHQLDQIQNDRRQLTKEVDELEQRRQFMEDERSAQLQALKRQLDALYRLGTTPQLKLLLSESDPSRLDRLQTYLNHLSKARNERLDALAELDRQLVANQHELDKREQRLDALQEDLDKRSKVLADQTKERQEVVAKLDQRYDTEASRLEQLSQDRAHAERVLREVQEAVARLSEPPPSTAIERTRGDLPWPVQGMMMTRYHQTRGVHYNGILIQAASGTKVEAVHAGRVVFADWMRGFGNLLIIDHGDQVMTLYAHLQQFSVDVGSRVEKGQAIGQVGESGGRSAPGLYFEVRRAGQPINPQSWIAQR